MNIYDKLLFLHNAHIFLMICNNVLGTTPYIFSVSIFIIYVFLVLKYLY